MCRSSLKCNVDDFVKLGRKYWLVVMVLHTRRAVRLVCFRNGERRMVDPTTVAECDVIKRMGRKVKKSGS
jgi:hypothetical protein